MDRTSAGGLITIIRRSQNESQKRQGKKWGEKRKDRENKDYAEAPLMDRPEYDRSVKDKKRTMTGKARKGGNSAGGKVEIQKMRGNGDSTCFGSYLTLCALSPGFFRTLTSETFRAP